MPLLPDVNAADALAVEKASKQIFTVVNAFAGQLKAQERAKRMRLRRR